MLSMPGHAPFPANRYVISKDDSRRLVLYWFWSHDRGVASEYWAKFYLVEDAIRMNRSDGSLVRFVTPMFPGKHPPRQRNAFSLSLPLHFRSSTTTSHADQV